MTDKKNHWFDKKSNVDKLIIGILFSCILLFSIDLFYEKHSLIFVEDWYGFYCVYGFIICCVIVFGGKLLRKLLIRKETFYDE